MWRHACTAMDVYLPFVQWTKWGFTVSENVDKYQGSSMPSTFEYLHRTLSFTKRINKK